MITTKSKRHIINSVKERGDSTRRLENELSMYLVMSSRNNKLNSDNKLAGNGISNGQHTYSSRSLLTKEISSRSLLTKNTGVSYKSRRLEDELRMFRLMKNKEQQKINNSDDLESIPTLDDPVSEITFQDSNCSYPIMPNNTTENYENYKSNSLQQRQVSSWLTKETFTKVNFSSVVSDVSTY